MIKAEQLKIGNWISNGERNFKVDGNNIYDADNFEEDSDVFNGITLTEEILLSSGFEKKLSSNKIDLFLLEELCIAKWITGFILYNETDDYYYSTEIGNEFHYVHQLQNLYFALTQKELNIKL